MEAWHIRAFFENVHLTYIEWLLLTDEERATKIAEQLSARQPSVTGSGMAVTR